MPLYFCWGRSDHLSHAQWAGISICIRACNRVLYIHMHTGDLRGAFTLPIVQMHILGGL